MALRGTLTHRKTRRLAQALNIPACFALGVLESLWHVTGEQAADGAIGRMSDADLAMEMFYDGDPAALVAALVTATLVDRDEKHRLIVHDWHLHSDDATDNRLSRSTKTYANGALPRMTKLSKPERANVCARFSAAGHKMPLPEPVPVPEPEPVIEKTLASTANAVPAERGKLIGRMPLPGKAGEYEIFEQDADGWQQTYPGVDVRQELRECKQWLVDNPNLRKTAKGMRRFINSWMAREQDKGGRASFSNVRPGSAEATLGMRDAASETAEDADEKSRQEAVAYWEHMRTRAPDRWEHDRPGWIKQMERGGQVGA